MTTTVSFPDLSSSSARVFYNSIGAAASIYLWLGRAATWPNEPTPNTPLSNVDTDVDARNNIEYLIQVTQADCCLAVPNVTWSSGTVYAQYSSSNPDLFGSNFYVLTGSNSVYKCIYNNNGAPSTSVPIGETTNIVTVADGYQWKFMYNLSSAISETFLSSAWCPVPTGAQETPFQQQVEQYAVYTTGSPPLGHGASAAQELGASDIIINIPVSLTALNPFQHRQFGLILNPTLLGSKAPATAASYVVDSNTLINVMSGDLLTCSNHNVVNSSVDASEIIQVVVSF
jgi:hypothetical protein